MCSRQWLCVYYGSVVRTSRDQDCACWSSYLGGGACRVAGIAILARDSVKDEDGKEIRAFSHDECCCLGEHRANDVSMAEPW